MNVAEYLSLNTKRHFDREKIINFYVTHISELPDKDYPLNESIKLKRYVDKFLSSLSEKRYISDKALSSYTELLDTYIEYLRDKRNLERKPKFFRFLSLSRNNIKFDTYIEDSYDELYTKTIKLLNISKEYDSYNNYLDVGEFYNPKISNKHQIKSLINEAIELLKGDVTLTEKTKKRIIEYLEKALSNLDEENTNWTDFIGKLKEVVIILGAVGSLAGGVAVFNAKTKIEEATKVIQQTSITVNFKSINETININNAPKLASFQSILSLEENNED